MLLWINYKTELQAKNEIKAREENINKQLATIQELQVSRTIASTRDTKKLTKQLKFKVCEKYIFLFLPRIKFKSNFSGKNGADQRGGDQDTQSDIKLKFRH